MPMSPAEPGSVDLANQITGSAEAGDTAVRRPEDFSCRLDMDAHIVGIVVKWLCLIIVLFLFNSCVADAPSPTSVDG